MIAKMSHEAKTGLLVLVCAAALTGLVLKVGNFTLLQKGYTVKSQFRFAGGVKKSSPVRLSGVDVGEVKDIRFIYGDETLVELDLWIRGGARVRLDSTAYVTTLGLMGEKYIEIKMGTAASPYAKDGDTLPGEDPVRLEELVAVGTKVAGDISQMAKDISRVTTHLDETLAGNRRKIDNIFDNLEETSENVRDFSQDVRFHPWKVLVKGKEKTREELNKDRADRLMARARSFNQVAPK